MGLENRVFLHVIGLPFYRRLVLPLSGLLFAVTLADANTNWTALRDQLAGSSPWQVSVLFTTLFMVWGLIAGRALRPIWRQPAIAFLVRQPLTRWQWVRHLLPPLSIAFLPILWLWWLAPHYGNVLLHYLGFAGLVWTIMLGASFRGVTAAKWIAVGVAVTAALILGYAYEPAVTLLAATVSIALLPLSVSGIQRQIVRSDQASRAGLSSISPVVAIIRRDLLCVWHLDRRSLFTVASLAIITSLFQVALRINAETIDHETFAFSCGLLSLALLPTYDILTRLKTRLGPELVRRRWPVNMQQRGFALVGLTFLLMAPSVVALCLTGSMMGPLYLVQFVVYAVTSLIALSALFSQTLLSSAVSLGWSLWILLIHPILAITLPWWLYAIVATSIIVGGSRLIVRGLRDFAQQSETRLRE